MVSTNNEEGTEEIHDELESNPAPKIPKLKEYIRIRIPSMQTRLLDQRSRKRRFLDFLKARPSVDWLKNFRLSSPLAIFRRTVNQKEEISLSVPSPVGIRRRFPIHFIRRINWASLFNICKDWLKNPMNIALLIWLICVAVSGCMLFLLLIGVLNQAFPTKSSRNSWIEINNQVLNALFTLMSLYQHPNLFHHLFLLFRWRSEDIIHLRKTYCKNAAYRPHEWAHMMVVLVLLHITCLAQYALCGLYWGYNSKTRPEFAEDVCFAVGIAAPVIAGVYTVYSPLGREYDSDSDEESLGQGYGDNVGKNNKLGLKLYDQRVLVSRPEWVGGLFDCREDATVGYLSFFCTFCVFGWNMERLGFGNMYVHIVTFFLLCIAPFWIFNITALNIHNEVFGDVVGITGLVLCVFGLLYGGFWRIQMRKRFKLPGNPFCCGSSSLTDYIQWMFCWSCSLAQEVRTGNFYDVDDDSLYRRRMDCDEESQPVLNPLRRESGSSPLIRSNLSSSLRSSTAMDGECSSPVGGLIVVMEESSELDLDDAMIPPVQVSIQVEDRVSHENIISSSPSSPLIQREGNLPPSN